MQCIQQACPRLPNNCLHSILIACRPDRHSADRELPLGERDSIGGYRPLGQLDSVATCRTAGPCGLRPAAGVRSPSNAAQPSCSPAAAAPFSRVRLLKLVANEQAALGAYVRGRSTASPQLLTCICGVLLQAPACSSTPSTSQPATSSAPAATPATPPAIPSATLTAVAVSSSPSSPTSIQHLWWVKLTQQLLH